MPTETKTDKITPLIARSESDEAIQALVASALDCFANARNNGMPHLLGS
jgi:hypothetical protein